MLQTKPTSLIVALPPYYSRLMKEIPDSHYHMKNNGTHMEYVHFSRPVMQNKIHMDVI